MPFSRLILNVECQPDLAIDSYPGPYGQVLTILLLNSVAHAFSDGKGGTVEIKVQASGPDNVEVIFSDDGCGMSLDVRHRAFDPFFTTRRDQGSTGLGLHIVHTIVTNCLGGRLHLDSEPGEGTRIQLVLPRVARQLSLARTAAVPKRRSMRAHDAVHRAPCGDDWRCATLAVSEGN